MNSLFKQKRLYIEADEGTTFFLWHYVDKKRKDVLDHAKRRAMYSCREENLKYFIVEVETEAGYGSQHGPPVYSKELSRLELTKEQVERLFDK